jgi:ferredoxin
MEAQFEITIENTGESFRCRDDEHVLGAMERALCRGIPVGCRNGGCGACKVQVMQGRYAKRKMNRAVVSLEEEERGVGLACKIYPQSGMKVKAIGAMADAMVAGKASFISGSTTAAEDSRPDKEA